MIMDYVIIMKKANEKLIFPYKAADNEWIRKSLKWNCVIINRKLFVNIKFAQINFSLRCSLLLTEYSESPISIIYIRNSKRRAIFILLNFLEFDERIGVAPYLFCECDLMIIRS